jgi:hypothetical protein
MGKECEFTVIDSTVEDGKDGEYLKQARKDNSGSSGTVLADSLKDMVDKILAKFDKDKCDCIKKLRIIGHGSEGLIIVGKGRHGDDAAKRINNAQSEWEEQLKRLKPKLCKKAEIEILACFFGAGEKGAKKLAALANVLDATVIGYNVYTTPGGYPKKVDGWKKVVASPGKPPEKVDKVETKLPTFKSRDSTFRRLQQRTPNRVWVTSGSANTLSREVSTIFVMEDGDNIRALLKQIDSIRAVDASLLGGCVDAELWIQYRGMRAQRFEVTDDYQHIGVPGAINRVHSISNCGQSWLRELAFLHQRAVRGASKSQRRKGNA